MSFSVFNETIHSYQSLILLFFPHLFGNEYFDNVQYFGPWYEPEMMIYLPIICFYSLIYLVFFYNKKNKIIKFWLFVSLISICMSLGNNIPFASELMYQVPILNKFRALARHSFEFNLALSVLTGIAISTITSEKNRYLFRSLILFSVFTGLVFLICYFQYKYIMSISGLPELMNSRWFENKSVWTIFIIHLITIVSFLAFIYKPVIITKVVFFFVVLTSGLYLALNSYGIGSAKPTSYLNLSDELRYLKDDMKIEDRIAEIDGVYTPVLGPHVSNLYGFNSISWYGPLLDREFSECIGLKTYGYIRPSILGNKNIIDMLNIKYLMVTDFTFARNPEVVLDKNLILKEERWNTKIYRNISDFSKFWVVPNLYYSTKRDICAKLSNSALYDIKQDAILVGDGTPQHIEQFDQNYQITDSVFQDGFYRLKVRISSPGLLVISEKFNDGWIAKVNGKNAELLKVNGVLQGVMLPPGTNVVEAYFFPDSLKLGIAISSFFSIWLICYLVCLNREYSRKEKYLVAQA